MRVAGAGDINGDGFADLLFADDDADSNAGAATGSVFILLGRDFGYRLDVAGDAGNNILLGTSADEALLGAAGNDLIDGGAGSDALLGGPGNDILVWDAADTHIDGGGNSDTLRISGLGHAIDFSLLQGPRVSGVEILDLRGSGNNAVTLGIADVMDMSDHNRLRIDGDAGDSISSLGQGWLPAASGNVIIDNTSYQAFESGGVTLLVDSSISVNIS
jgi:Ca2+-binding RTX toxin-like protein